MDVSILNDARFHIMEQEFAVCFHEENEKLWYMKVYSLVDSLRPRRR